MRRCINFIVKFITEENIKNVCEKCNTAFFSIPQKYKVKFYETLSTPPA